MINPAGHHAWHATIFFVFSVLYTVAISGLITPSTSPCDSPNRKNPTNSIVVPGCANSDCTGASGCGASVTSATPRMKPTADDAWSTRMPTMSRRLPVKRIASVNAKNAGLNTAPICSLVR